MTEDFDFDFDVDRARSASRTESRDTEPADGDAPATGRRSRKGTNGNGSRGNGTPGNGSANGGRGYAARAKELLDRRGELLYEDQDERDGVEAPSPRASDPPRSPRFTDEPGTDDWLSVGDDVFEPGNLSPLRQRDDGPAGPPTPGEARNFAKEARRRASRRPP